MYPAYMVTEVPVAGESISSGTTLTTLRSTQVWLITMPVHSVSFTFVAEEASHRREAGGYTRIDLTLIRLQVGVNSFTTK